MHDFLVTGEDKSVYFPAPVQDRRVIATAQEPADSWQRIRRHRPHEPIA